MTVQQWNERLKDKVDGYRTMTEAAFARQCHDAGLSVHKAEKAINSMRRGISQ